MIDTPLLASMKMRIGFDGETIKTACINISLIIRFRTGVLSR
jgi:hypothetical protein